MNKAEKVEEAWDEIMEGSFWHEITDDELYRLQAYLWAMHQDSLMEWTRRQMREKDPKR